MSDRSSLTELTPSLLLRAYAAGVFPMADSADADEIFWIDPDMRRSCRWIIFTPQEASSKPSARQITGWKLTGISKR